MKFTVFVLTFSLILLQHNVFSVSPDVLEIVIKALLKTLNGTITLPNNNINLLVNFSDTYAIGTVNLSNSQIISYETLKINTLKVEALSTVDSLYTNNNITVDISFDKIGLVTDYIMDLGIAELIPLFGNGTVHLEVQKAWIFVNLNLTDRSLKNISLSNLNIQFSLRHSTNNFITGFFENDDISKFLSKVINSVLPLIFMVLDYEMECIDCWISRIVQLVVNLLIKAGFDHPMIDCKCSDSSTYNIGRSLESVFGYIEGENPNLFKDIKKENIIKYYTNVTNYIEEMLESSP